MTGHEAQSEIEVPCGFRNRVNHNPPNTDHLCRLGDAHGRVSKPAAQPQAMPPGIDSQPGQHHHGNRIGHNPTEASRSGCNPDYSGSEGIIGDDSTTLADYVCASRTAELIGARTAAQPLDERGLSAREALKVMPIVEQCGRWQACQFSQGARVVSERRRRALG